LGIDEAGLGLPAGGDGVEVGVAAGRRCGRCGCVDDCLCYSDSISYDCDYEYGKDDAESLL